MSNLLNVRRFWRPDQPQPVYAGAVDAQVRTWIPAVESERKGERVRDLARLDVRTQDWAPQQGWIQPAVDRVTRTWAPAWSAELASGERTRQAPGLDVRRYDWAPETAWYTFSLVDTVTPTRAGIWSSQQQTAGVRTPAAAALDVRTHLWASDGWRGALATAPTIAAWAPAFAAELNAERSRDRVRLDVRGHEWSPETGWIARVVDAVVAKWAPSLFAERQAFRAPERARLDVRHDWRTETGWISYQFAAPPPTTAQLRPAISGPGGLRTEPGVKLDVRRLDPFPAFGWLYKAAIMPRHGVHIVGIDSVVTGIAAGLGGVLATGVPAGLEAGTKATGIAAGGSDASGLVWGIDDAL